MCKVLQHAIRRSRAGPSSPAPSAIDVARRLLVLLLTLGCVAGALVPQLAPKTVHALVRHDEDECGRRVAGKRFEIGDRLCVSQPSPELVLNEDPDHAVRVADREIREVVPVLFFGRYSVLV